MEKSISIKKEGVRNYKKKRINERIMKEKEEIKTRFDQIKKQHQKDKQKEQQKENEIQKSLKKRKY